MDRASPASPQRPRRALRRLARALRTRAHRTPVIATASISKIGEMALGPLNKYGMPRARCIPSDAERTRERPALMFGVLWCRPVATNRRLPSIPSDFKWTHYRIFFELRPQAPQMPAGGLSGRRVRAAPHAAAGAPAPA